MKLLTLIKHLLIIFLVLFASLSRAGDETKTARINNPQPNSGLIVHDDKYLAGNSTQFLPNWYTFYSTCDNSSKVFIEFGLDETQKLFHAQPFTSVIKFDVTAYDQYNTATTFVNQQLTINYDPNKGTSYVDKSTLLLNDFYFVDITVNQVITTQAGSAVSNPVDLYLEGKIQSTRNYLLQQFNATTANQVNKNYLYATNELEIYWPNLIGAEAYELEWHWANTYGFAQNNYDFRYNATRIRTTNNSYKIPLVYEAGIICYRVRPIGRLCNTGNVSYEGRWNTDVLNIPDQGSDALLPANFYFVTGQFEADKFNWSSTMTFDENGKKGIGVSLADALLKPHYSIAKLNTENNIIVSSTLYDFQGRAAVNVLPSPVEKSMISYIPKLNQFTPTSGPGVNFDKNIFDVDGGTCVNPAPKISAANSGGASSYYSPNFGIVPGAQTTKDGQQAFLPNAGEYPYVRVEYSPDVTGRIVSQTSPGETFKVGSGKETKYLYSSPGDRELDRLFGTEVGAVSHYKKNATIDANGQMSVNYIDMNGRTIATALSGQAPDNVDALDSYATSAVNLTEHLLNKNKTSPYELSVNTSLIVGSLPDQQQFTYEFTPKDIVMGCLSNYDFCLNCVYELDLSIKDECGNELLDLDAGTPGFQTSIVVGQINHVPSDEAPCSPSPKFSLPAVTLNVSFPKIGKYYISKTLKVSDINIEKYWSLYHTLCSKKLETIKNELLNNIDFSTCNFDCVQCSTSVNSYVSQHPSELTPQQITDLLKECGTGCEPYDPCESSRRKMLHDLTPNLNNSFAGQYAQGTTGTPLSIFGGSQSLVDYSTLSFQDANGNPAMVLNSANVLVPANQLTVQEFIANFQPSWANALLPYHPEYCYLQFCETNKASLVYDNDMLEVDTYDEACSKGFILPLGNLPSTACQGGANCISCPSFSNYDPFFTSGFAGSSSAFTMINEIYSNYNSTPQLQITQAGSWITPLVPSSYNLSQLNNNPSGVCAYYLASSIVQGSSFNSSSFCFGSSGCYKDQEWRIFRALYLSKKLKLYENLRQSYAVSNGCVNTCIGSTPATPFAYSSVCTQNTGNTPNCVVFTGFGPVPGYNAAADPNTICNSGNASLYSVKQKVFLDFATLLSQGPQALGNQAGGINTPNPIVTSVPNFYLSNCTAYADSWMQILSSCNGMVPGTSLYTDVRNNLIAICAYGSDANHPLGVTKINPGEPHFTNSPSSVGSNFPANYNYNSPGPHYNNINQVLQAYSMYNATSCNADILITYPSSSETYNFGTPKLNDCGCTQVMDHYYLSYLPNQSSLPAGVTNASQLWNYYSTTLNDRPQLQNFDELLCTCQKAYAYGVSPTPPWTAYSTYNASQLSYLDGFAVTMPTEIKCCPINNGGRLAQEVTAFNELNIPDTLAGYYQLRANFLNNRLNQELTPSEYQVYIDANSGVRTNSLSEVFNTDVALKESERSMVQDFLNNMTVDSSLVRTKIVSANMAPDLVSADVFFEAYKVNDTILYATSESGKNLEITLTSKQYPDYFKIIYLSLPQNANFSFSDIKSFNELYNLIPIEKVSLLDSFVVKVDLKDPKQMVDPSLLYVTGSTNIFINSIARSLGIISMGREFSACNVVNVAIDENDCVQDMIDQVIANANYLYNHQADLDKATFIKNYKAACLGVTDEKFERNYILNEHHYTLYYYDQAGNLTRTIPPNGVKPLTSPADFTAIDLFRTSGGPAVYPAHEYVSNYNHISYNSTLGSISPDEEDKAIYIYDYLGRIVGSQNAKQKAKGSGVFSYTLYDFFSRIVEVGQVEDPTANFTALVSYNYNNNAAFNAGSWGQQIFNLNRTQVVKTVYDKPFNLIIPTLFNGGQNNLRNRVSSVLYYEKATNAAYDYGTHFSYDVHGNVIQLVQENTKLKPINQDVKIVDYEYDLISGNVNKVIYQQDENDQFIHQYKYDDDNRLHEVFTSKDGVNFDRDAKYLYYKHGPLARVEIGDKQVNGIDYAYTIQGWIKGINSTVLTPDKDMGKDANYSNQYISSKANIHANFAKDAAGYTINYFNSQTNALLDDYSPIKVTVDWQANESNIRTTNPLFNLDNHAPSLFNGNISSMVTTYLNNDPFSTVPLNSPAPQITAFTYDQLNRLVGMRAFRELNTNPSSSSYNTWGGASAVNYDGSYKQQFTYDANGNIGTMKRNGATNLIASNVAGISMDDMTYVYQQSQSTAYPGRKTNKLAGINDIAAGSYADDIKQTSSALPNSSTTWNYLYDEIGNLQTDISEHIGLIVWTVDNKVRHIIRDKFPNGLGYPPHISYEYDANRQRVCKIVKPRTGPTAPSNESDWIFTYYVRDAQGQVMAIYEKTYISLGGNSYTEKYQLKEFDLYGSSRLGTDFKNFSKTRNFTANVDPTTGEFINKVYGGNSFGPPFVSSIFNRKLGNKTFELTNHLGNVISTITDRKVPVQGQGGTPYTQLFQRIFDDNNLANVSTYDANDAFSIVSGKLNVVPNTTGTSFGGVQFKVPMVYGQSYNISFDYFKNTTVTSDGFSAWVFAKNPSNPSSFVTWQLPSSANDPSGTYSFNYNNIIGGGVFTDYYVVFMYQNTSNGITNNFDLDNVTVSVQNVVIPPTQVATYLPDMMSTNDYYAFGQEMPGRRWASNIYRYGMNGQEKESEVFNGANSAEYWMYDARTGKRWGLDPILKPWESPYATFAGNPLFYSDPSGLTATDPTDYKDEKGNTITKTNDGYDKTVVIPDDKRKEFDIALAAAEKYGVRDYEPTNRRLRADYGMKEKVSPYRRAAQDVFRISAQNAALAGNARSGNQWAQDVTNNAATAFHLFFEWSMGTGPNERMFDENSVMGTYLLQTPEVQEAVGKLLKNPGESGNYNSADFHRSLADEGKVDYVKSFFEDVKTNPTRAFHGSFAGIVQVQKVTKIGNSTAIEIIVTMRDNMTAMSGSRLPPPIGYGPEGSVYNQEYPNGFKGPLKTIVIDYKVKTTVTTIKN